MLNMRTVHKPSVSIIYYTIKDIKYSRWRPLKNNRISTTISAKHWGVLLKLADKYGTQQKALELAIENLENPTKAVPRLSPEEATFVRVSTEIDAMCLLPKEAVRILMTSANLERARTYIEEQTPLEWTFEYFFQKPLKDLSLKEIVEGVIFFGKMAHWFETATYSDESDHYSMKISHSMGINASKVHEMMIEGAFKRYGTKTIITTSERSVFVKAYKK
jgi:hypothetical protein